MCSWIVEKAVITGSGKGAEGWFPLTQANVSFDHSTHTFMDDSLNIDFVNQGMGPSARIAVEISADSGRELIKAIEEALKRWQTHNGIK